MKILVVEDNSKLARFLSRALTEDGHVVDVVSEGATALHQVVDLPYDVVLLDWMLPDIDGLSVCREIRARGLRVPILMLTARAEVPERIAGLNAGADDYLAKPFDLGELLARVRALHRRGGAAPQLQVLGALTFDRGARQISARGRPLALTAREYGLLAHLADAAGRTVPRTELLAKLWGIHFDPGSNVVEVHIKNLRDKLGPQHLRPLLSRHPQPRRRARRRRPRPGDRPRGGGERRRRAPPRSGVQRRRALHPRAAGGRDRPGRRVRRPAAARLDQRSTTINDQQRSTINDQQRRPQLSSQSPVGKARPA